ncbi:MULTISPECIES: extracellular solute-binding protein [unclassified Rhizobium]|uniref:extracellular solute-binding protein n=1 Tax=unclassified Rhizobium TaxID=2613769 RepID=UPI000CF24CB7|nr:MULTISPECIES: extracellular solute-binding protein [Rhizobium]MDK4741909.1 extracellular solute-binding protein [Rhizobium sp. CNPSo 3464]UWU20358.1 extracellular solute-binding protein [Rhizobium tropici]
MMVTLKGMTWSHPRGYDPMVACSAIWKEKTGVEVVWEKRSLQDFETFPVEELAAAYDLIVIDHPHVGQITRENCLLPLDDADHAGELVAIAAGTVGRSYPSYNWQGRQWGFPIDAATQVQAYRPDRLSGPITDLAEIVSLAARGRAILPMRPPHSLMTFFTLAAHLGTPCSVEGPELIATADGEAVLDWMARLVGGMDAKCDDMDPIAVFELMGELDCPYDVVPFAYGYVSYSFAGFRPARLAFADMPVIDGRAPKGSALGGTGIAVSARTQVPEEAKAFARWIASGPVQAGAYASGNGQPGHADAWGSDSVNGPALDFYRNTRATLEGAYVRPRHDGYMAFQSEASNIITNGLRTAARHTVLIDKLNQLFAQSFES